MEQTQNLSALGPVARVFAICNANPTASRKEIIAACLAAGVGRATAQVQYGRWRDPEKFAAKEKARDAARYAANSDKIKVQQAEYRARPEIKAQKAAWQAKHGPELDAKRRPYRNEFKNRRRSHERQATPAWTNLDLVRQFWDDAARMTADTGTEFHVDHIHAINGQRFGVSGLHNEFNLHILDATTNIRKGNRPVVFYPQPRWELGTAKFKVTESAEAFHTAEMARYNSFIKETQQ